MENQEQNSLSENTSPEIAIEEMARPYRAFIPIEGSTLQGLMDEYWDKNAQNLISFTGYKGKKGKGGLVDLDKARKAIEATHGLIQILS
jgi:hypothetical protein